MAVRMMAVLERQKDLQEIVPYRVLRYGAVVFERLVDNGGEVSTTADDIKDAGFTIDMTIMVPDNEVMVQIFDSFQTVLFETEGKWE